MARAATFFCLFAVLGAAVLGPGPGASRALAQSYAPGPFTVLGVAVDTSAEDASKARALALAEGQREGLKRVLEQLTLAEDYPLLPKVDESLANRLIASFEILDERVSAQRYRAALNIRFKEDEVRALLRAAGVRFTEAAAPPTLVLPLLLKDGAPLLWEEPNPWFAAWREHKGGSALVPLIVPLGDLADMGTLPSAAAASGDIPGLARIAQRYGAAGALIARASLHLDAAGGAPSLGVELLRSSGGQFSAERLAVAGEPEAPLEALYAAAVTAVERRLTETWKTAHLMRFGSESRLIAEVPLSGLADWVALRERLAQQANVRRVDLLTISTGQAEIAINYTGDLLQLQEALRQAGIELARESEAWRLSFSPRPAAWAAPAAGPS